MRWTLPSECRILLVCRTSIRFRYIFAKSIHATTCGASTPYRFNGIYSENGASCDPGDGSEHLDNPCNKHFWTKHQPTHFFVDLSRFVANAVTKKSPNFSCLPTFDGCDPYAAILEIFAMREWAALPLRSRYSE